MKHKNEGKRKRWNVKSLEVAILLTCTFSLSTLWAQSPEKMSYQAVVRNSSNALVTNTQIGVWIIILQGSTMGKDIYFETQTPTTNANGLVSIEIGGEKGFASPYYWSSTEGSSSNYAWLRNFAHGGEGYSSKDFTASVRAVRAF